ncbi:MAG: hypothetical protein IJ083_05455 [Clostridia bacterium]|nr:hypothetical protein [Clostridia bacterium]
MFEIIIILAICAVIGVVMSLIALIVGIDLLTMLISYLLPFLLCLLIAGAVSFLLLFLLSIFTHGGGVLSSHFAGITVALSIVLAILIYHGYWETPVEGFHVPMSEVNLFAYYNMKSGHVEDVVSSPERVEQLREMVSNLKMHRHHRQYVPSYAMSLVKAERLCSIGLFRDGNTKLYEFSLYSDNTICIYTPDSDTPVWFDLFDTPDVKAFRAVLSSEQHARALQRIRPLNDERAEACFDGITCEDGALIIRLPEFDYDKSLYVKVDAIAQHEKFSYALQDMDLMALAGLPYTRPNGSDLAVPIPQERLYKSITVRLILDGIIYERDMTSLLPASLLQETKP